jgi:hypothetical protein
MNEQRAGDVVLIESFTAQPQTPAFAILAGACGWAVNKPQHRTLSPQIMVGGSLA